MKCPACGKEVQEGAIYCNNCGEELKKITEEDITQSSQTTNTSVQTNKAEKIINTLVNTLNKIKENIKNTQLGKIQLYQFLNIVSWFVLIIGIIVAFTQSYTTSYWIGTKTFSMMLFIIYLVAFVVSFFIIRIIAKHLENQAEIIKLLKEIKK